MVGLSDIPVVGKAVDMISEAMVKAAYRGLRYMFCYKSLVNDLNSAIDKFKVQEGRVSTKVVEERDNGKILEDHVSKWQKDVEDTKENAKEFMERYKKRASWRCIRCVPIPNPLSRFRLGREAEQMSKMVSELTESGKELLDNPIARLPPVENLPKTDGEFQNFQSRKDAYKKIWESLVTEGGPQILGIYGMPGVGKTRIAEQIWEEAKAKKVFDKVTRAVVSSGKLDVIKLQNDLARHLNCKFESQDDIDSRASQLKHSIMNGGKVLIILDDVWREIHLDVIGIPFSNDTTSSKGTCKILLTSREENVLRGNNCINPVKITALTDDEAWDMFKESVGTGDIPDESLARKVCDKCAGLPLVIRAVGKALMKFESRDLWVDALKRLEDCEIESVPGIDAEVYACLKLSFDNLVKDAKLCLLLCSLYPEDAEFPMDMLINLATGSQLVRGGRIRVRAMVALLKSSSLVLESERYKYGGGFFKLHDIIRDVARSVAENDHAFIFPKSSDSRLLHINGNPELLCLDVNNNNFYFPDDMLYQGIHTLWIGSISYERLMFQVWKVAGMCVNLRCLILRKIEWKVPVEQYLGKLRTLVLDDCDIRNTDFSFISEKLETLCIWNCFLPLPLNIINLKHLRKLEIFLRIDRVVLVANTISSLSSCLEELHIPEGYSYEQEEEDEVNTNNMELMEISKLTCLKSLKMRFTRSASPHEEELIQDLKKVFSNLSEFDISIGDRTVFASDSSLMRLIYLSGNQLETDTFQILIERAQFVLLRFINVDVSSIFNCNTDTAAFADLKYLYILNSDTMEHVARISHRRHQIQPRTSFSQLTTLHFTNCSAMKYLFCNSVAKCLVQLEKLFVKDCNAMEAIVMNDGSSYIDGQQDIIINFPKLKSLTIRSTPQLKSFYLDNKVVYSTNLFDDKIAFPTLEELWLVSLSISDIWGKHHFNDNASSFSKLKKLTVLSCTKLETVIPLAMLHKLQNLEYLYIKDCSLVISEVGTYDSNTAFVCPLLALTEMRLHKLPCLTKTWLNSILDHSGAVLLTNLYPKLKKLEIWDCNSLRNVFLPSVARDLMHLELLYVNRCKMMTEIIGAAAAAGDYNISKELKVDDCEMMTEIIGAAAEEHKISTGGIIFPKLRTLCLVKLKNLTSFRRNQSGEANNIGKDVLFPNLETCKIMCCDKINFKDTEFWRDGVPSQLMSLIIRFDEEIQLIPCTWDLRNLEYLTLANCWWHEQHIIPSFSRLRTLHVFKSGRSTLFPFSVISSLQQLVGIEISDCALLEGIVEEDVRRGNIEASSSRDKKQIIKLFRLEYVTLKGLPNLRSFMSGADYECHMPALTTVEIDNCGLSTLFTCSTNLQQLRWLKVSNCRLLEYIFGDVRDDDDISKTDDKIIIICSCLLRIELDNLPNLKSFGRNSSYDFDMPELGRFTLLQCPQVDNFSSLKTSTGRSIIVTSDWNSNGEDVENLNDYIKENRKRDDSNLISDEGAAAGETDDS